MIIRPATDADVPRVLEMARAFLASTVYGRLFPQAGGGLEDFVAGVMSIGVILLAVTDRPARCTGFQEGDYQFCGEEMCAMCGEAARFHTATVVGMIALATVPHPLTLKPYTDELAWWVDVDYRGSSIGPRLLEAAERWAVESGATMLKMVAPADAPAVGAFYVRRGYTLVETVYQKILAAPPQEPSA